MSIQYSPLCDVSFSAYVAYLVAVRPNVSGLFRSSGFLPASGGSGAVCDHTSHGDRLLVSEEGVAEAAGVLSEDAGGGDVGGAVGGGGAGVESAGCDGAEAVKRVEVTCVIGDGESQDQVGVGGVVQRGKNYLRNKASRDRKKRRRVGGSKVDGGLPSLVGSRCVTLSTVGTRTSLQESFDKRREMENMVAVRKCELQLARLKDEKAVAAFDDMIHKQRIQKSVRATELAEKSLASTESISPSSSASQYEIRQMFKRCEELEERERHHSKFREDLLRIPGLPGEVKELMLFDAMGASTIDRVAEEWLGDYPEV